MAFANGTNKTSQKDGPANKPAQGQKGAAADPIKAKPVANTWEEFKKQNNLGAKQPKQPATVAPAQRSGEQPAKSVPSSWDEFKKTYGPSDTYKASNIGNLRNAADSLLRQTNNYATGRSSKIFAGEAEIGRAAAYQAALSEMRDNIEKERKYFEDNAPSLKAGEYDRAMKQLAEYEKQLEIYSDRVGGIAKDRAGELVVRSNQTLDAVTQPLVQYQNAEKAYREGRNAEAVSKELEELKSRRDKFEKDYASVQDQRFNIQEFGTGNYKEQDAELERYDARLKKMNEQLGVFDEKITSLQQELQWAEMFTLRDMITSATRAADFKEKSKPQDIRPDPNGADREAIKHHTLINQPEIANGIYSSGEEFSHMTDEEKNIYNYIFNTQGEETAENYLSYLNDTLMQREGTAVAERMDYPVLRELYATGAGVEGWFKNAGQLMTRDVRENNATDYAMAELMSDAGTLSRVSMSAAQSVGNQLPSMVIGSVAGPVGGAISIGAGAAGGAYTSARNEGMSEDAAKKYALMIGASEATLQYFLGGISKLGGKAGSALSAKIGEKVSQLGSVYARTAIRYAGNVGSEIIEEVTQEYLDPLFRAMAAGEEYDAPTFEALLEVAASTAISTIALGAAGGDIKSTYQKEQVRELAKAAMNAPKDSDIYKVGKELNEKLDSEDGVTGEEVLNAIKRMGMSEDTKVSQAIKATKNSIEETRKAEAMAQAPAATAQTQTAARADAVQQTNPDATVIRSASVQAYIDTKTATLQVAQEAGAVLDKALSGEAVTDSEIDKLKLTNAFGAKAVSAVLGVPVQKATTKAAARAAFRDALAQYEQSAVATATAEAQRRQEEAAATFQPENELPAEANTAPLSGSAEMEQPAMRDDVLSWDEMDEAKEGAVEYAEFEKQYRAGNPKAKVNDIVVAYDDYLQSFRSDFDGPGARRDEYSARVEPKTVDAIDSLAKLLNLRVRFADLSGDNGTYQDGVVTLDINPLHEKASDAFLFSAAHEIAHGVKEKSAEAWRALEDYAVKIKGGKKAIQAKRSESATYNTDARAREELACDFIGEVLSDQETLDTFTEALRSGAFSTEHANIIVRVFRSTIGKLFGKGRKAGAATDALVQRVKALYGADLDTAENAVREMQKAVSAAVNAEKNTTEEGGVTKYAKKANTKSPATSPLSGSPNKGKLSMASKPVTAAAEHLGIDSKIAQTSDSVKNAIASFSEIVDAIDNKTPVFNGKKPISAANLEGALVKAGVLERRGAFNSAYREDGDHTLRLSDHSSRPDNFETAGENLSIVLLKTNKTNDFSGNDTDNVIEVQFKKDYLDRNPEAFKNLVKDMARFVATGEYHDTAGAKSYHISGTEQFRKEMTQRLAEDEQSRRSATLEVKHSRKDVPTTDKDNNGRPLSKNQMEYFRDSRVRDADGNLLTVFHGTDQAFTVFDILKAGKNGRAEGFGFYFSDDQEITGKYGDNQMEVYLNITKPLYSDQRTLTKAELQRFTNDIISKEMQRDGIDWRDSFISNYIDTYTYTGRMSRQTAVQSFINQIWEMNETDQDLIYEIANGSGQNYSVETMKGFYETLRDSIGVDGNISTWRHADGESRVYVAFFPEQAKNVDNRNPTANPDIRYSKKIIPSKAEGKAYAERYGTELTTEGQLERAKAREDARAKLRRDVAEGVAAQAVQNVETSIEEGTKKAPKPKIGIPTKAQAEENRRGFEQSQRNAAEREFFHRLASTAQEQAINDEVRFIKAAERAERLAERVASEYDAKIARQKEKLEHTKRQAGLEKAFRTDAEKENRKLNRETERLAKERDRIIRTMQLDAIRNSLDSKEALKAIRRWRKNGKLGEASMSPHDVDTQILTIQRQEEAAYADKPKGVKEKTKAIADQLDAIGKRLAFEFTSDVLPFEEMGRLQERTDSIDTAVTLFKNRRSMTNAILTDALRAPDGTVLDHRSARDILGCWKDDKVGGKIDEDRQQLFDLYLYMMHSADRMSVEATARAKMNAFLERHPEYKQYAIESVKDDGTVASTDLTKKALDVVEQAAKGDAVAQEYIDLATAFASAKNKPVFGTADGKKALDFKTSRMIAKQIESSNPWVKQKADEYYAWWDKFMRAWYVGSFGTEAQYESMRKMYPHYVPTFRAMKNKDNLWNYGSGGIGTKSPIQKAKGSTMDLNTVGDNIATQIERIVDMGMRNTLFVNTYEGALNGTAGFEEYVQIIPSKRDAAPSTKALIIYTEDVVPDDARRGEESFAKGEEGYAWKGFYNGEARTLLVNKRVYDSLRSLTSSGEWNKGLSKVASAGSKVTAPMKTAITGINPAFATRNIPRDFTTAMVNSVAGVKFPKYYAMAIAKMFGQTAASDKIFSLVMKAFDSSISEETRAGVVESAIKAMDEARLKGSREWNDFVALGGTGATYARAETGFLWNDTARGKVRKVLQRGKSALGAFNEATESVTRFAEYLATIDKYGDTAEGRARGIKNAAEVTVDFSRHGRIGKIINAWAPYWNPGIQGISKIYRSIRFPGEGNKLVGLDAWKQRGKVFARGAIGVGIIPRILQVALLYLLGGQEEWDEMTDRVKDTYFLIPIRKDGKPTGEFVKIPYNRDWGTLFGTTFSRVLQGAQGREDNWANFYDTAIEPNFGVAPNIIGFTQLRELDKNEDFAGRAITPYSMEGVARTEQYDEETSWIAKAIAKTPIGSAFGLNPMEVDHLVSSYFGDYGDMLIEATDKDGIGGMEALFKDVIGGSFTADNAYSSLSVSRYYDMLDKYDEAVATAKHKDPEGYKSQKDYQIKNALDSNFGDRITELNKAIRESGDEEEKRLLKYQLQEVAREALAFAEMCENGEIGDPIRYLKYEPYGDDIRNELIRLKKYEGEDYDYTFLPNPSAPKIGHSKNTDEEKAAYADIYNKHYSDTVGNLISSKEYGKADDEQKLEYLEDARDLAYFYAKREWAKKFNKKSESYDPETDTDRYDALMDAGLSFFDAYSVNGKVSDLRDDKNLSAEQQLTEFKRWVDMRSDLTQAQKDAIIRQYKFTGITVAKGEKYDELTETYGLSPDKAANVYNVASNLPEDHTSHERNAAIVSIADLTNEERYDVLLSYYDSDSNATRNAKISAAQAAGIPAETYVAVWSDLNSLESDKDKNGKTITNSLKNKRAKYLRNAKGLTDAQKNLIWREYYESGRADGWKYAY